MLSSLVALDVAQVKIKLDPAISSMRFLPIEQRFSFTKLGFHSMNCHNAVE
ncbi:hypothetical protein JHK82_054115 [Glycine max]|nr:hypothetical protein JHK82_054115 [Glycine max]